MINDRTKSYYHEIQRDCNLVRGEKDSDLAWHGVYLQGVDEADSEAKQEALNHQATDSLKNYLSFDASGGPHVPPSILSRDLRFHGLMNYTKILEQRVQSCMHSFADRMNFYQKIKQDKMKKISVS